MSNSGPILLFFPGSFDPPTCGHLRVLDVAKDVLSARGFNVVGGIVSPVHDDYAIRKPTLIESTHRLNMIHAAIAEPGYRWLTVSDIEISESTWMTTKESLERHQTMIAAFCDGEEQRPEWINEVQISAVTDRPRLMLLVAADVFESFPNPDIWSPEDVTFILRDFGVVVASRNGIDVEAIIHRNSNIRAHLRNIQIVRDMVGNVVSSTLVRNEIRAGYSVRQLIPDSVIQYIRVNNLYNIPQAEYQTLELRDGFPDPKLLSKEFSDGESQTSVSTVSRDSQVVFDTIEMTTQTLEVTTETSETTTQTIVCDLTESETQTSSTAQKEMETQTQASTGTESETQTNVLDQIETETQTKTPDQNQSSTQTSVAANDNSEMSTQTKTSQYNDGITQTKTSQLNDGITQTTNVSDDAPVKIVLEKPMEEKNITVAKVEADIDVCCKYLSSEDVCVCGDVSGGDGDFKVDDNECSFSCSSECSSCSCLDPSTNLESQFSQNATEIPGNGTEQACEVCVEQPEVVEEKDDTEPTLIEVSNEKTTAEKVLVEEVKDVSSSEPVAKETKRSRSRHHADKSEKGPAPAVQFEITSKGVRVISEKESFL